MEKFLEKNLFEELKKLNDLEILVREFKNCHTFRELSIKDISKELRRYNNLLDYRFDRGLGHKNTLKYSFLINTFQRILNKIYNNEHEAIQNFIEFLSFADKKKPSKLQYFFTQYFWKDPFKKSFYNFLKRNIPEGDTDKELFLKYSLHFEEAIFLEKDFEHINNFQFYWEYYVSNFYSYFFDKDVSEDIKIKLCYSIHYLFHLKYFGFEHTEHMLRLAILQSYGISYFNKDLSFINFQKELDDDEKEIRKIQNKTRIKMIKILYEVKSNNIQSELRDELYSAWIKEIISNIKNIDTDIFLIDMDLMEKNCFENYRLSNNQQKRLIKNYINSNYKKANFEKTESNVGELQRYNLLKHGMIEFDDALEFAINTKHPILRNFINGHFISYRFELSSIETSNILELKSDAINDINFYYFHQRLKTEQLLHKIQQHLLETQNKFFHFRNKGSLNINDLPGILMETTKDSIKKNLYLAWRQNQNISNIGLKDILLKTLVFESINFNIKNADCIRLVPNATNSTHTVRDYHKFTTHLETIVRNHLEINNCELNQSDAA